MLDGIKQKADAAGVTCDYALVRGRAPHNAIVKQAKKLKCDLIIMGSHGRRALPSILLGSETTKVLTYSKIPVLVVR